MSKNEQPNSNFHIVAKGTAGLNQFKYSDSDNAPDYFGKTIINDTEYNLAFWLKDGKYGKFLAYNVSVDLRRFDEDI